MEIGQKLVLILLLSLCSIYCFPSRPLNDRPSELTWQAWLLVDSQNQLQNESDRRITPKSVFIAPKLDGQKNDSLPDCAEGYKADAMGRCIKLVKVDEAAHLNFLLQRLNEMYAAQISEEFEEDLEDESLPTAGPLQVNIPLGQAEEIDSGDVSMVDTLTNGKFNADAIPADKFNVKRHPDTKILETKPSSTERITEPSKEENVKETEEIENEEYNDYDENTEINETTTQTEPTTTEVDDGEEVSIIPTTEEVTETTEYATTSMPEINDDLKALFFLMPTNNTTEKNVEVTTTKPTKVTPKAVVKPVEVETIVAQTSSISHIIEHHPIVKEEMPQIEPVVIQSSSSKPVHLFDRLKLDNRPVVEGSIQPIHQQIKGVPKIEPFILEMQKPFDPHRTTFKYPEPTVTFRAFTESFEYYDVETTTHPEVTTVRQVTPPKILSDGQIREFFKQFMQQRPPSYQHRRQASHHLQNNHRNRDRHGDLWNSSPHFRQEEPPQNKPLRYHDRYQDRYPPGYYPQGLYNPKHLAPHHERQYYGEETRQDYSNAYGRKRRRGNLR